MMKFNLILVAIFVSAHVANADEDRPTTIPPSDVSFTDLGQSPSTPGNEAGETTQSTTSTPAPTTSSLMPSAPTPESTSTASSTTQPTVTNSSTTTTTTTTTTTSIITTAATTTSKAISSNFDAGSFVGGFVLCGAIVLLIYIGCKLFRNKKPDYNTI